MVSTIPVWHTHAHTQSKEANALECDCSELQIYEFMTFAFVVGHSHVSKE